MSNKEETKRLKEAATMTAGVTPNKLELGATIDLHGHPTKITHTDATDTTVQYANLARRTFDTHILNSFLELGTFPVGTALERATVYRNERAIIEAVSGDCCYQVRITAGSDLPRHETYTYADFIAWHMDNTADGVQKLTAEDRAFIEKVAGEEADKLAAVLDEPDEHTNPFEEELQKHVEQLTTENFGLKTLIHSQALEHDTVIAGYEEDIKRLEKKAAILNPEPTRKEVCTLEQKINAPEARKKADQELADKLNEEWKPLNVTITSNPDEPTLRYVTLVRDLPAEQPRITLTAAVTERLHIGAVPLTQRPPVQQPPMPANQSIHQPVSRALTNNVNRDPGATKRIPTLADIQERHERNDAEIAEIAQRGRATQEAIRQRYAQTPRPFITSGVQS